MNYNLPDPWYLVSGPIMTANWAAAKAGDVWTVPLGGGVGKLFRLGQLLPLEGDRLAKLPINIKNMISMPRCIIVLCIGTLPFAVFPSARRGFARNKIRNPNFEPRSQTVPLGLRRAVSRRLVGQPRAHELRDHDGNVELSEHRFECGQHGSGRPDRHDRTRANARQ